MDSQHTPLPLHEKLGPSESKKKPNALFIRLLVVFGAMYAILTGVRHLPARSLRFTLPQCLGGAHRALSTAKLPSHYTLPSGDKIPSVALGASTFAE